jgi:hypothetical protein
MKKIYLRLFSLMAYANRVCTINFFSLAALFLLFGLVHCKKAGGNSVLPPITQTGANTFGCMVNGKVWLPHWACNRFGVGSVQLTYAIYPLNPGRRLPLLFSLSAGNSANGNTFFDFGQNSTLSDHIYSTGNIIDSLHISFLGLPGGQYLDANQPGATPHYFQITKLDTINKIVSGIFAFTLYARDSPNAQPHLDSVLVTDSRFDVQIGQWADCSR